jgi:serine/threonine protein kinase
MTDRFGDYELIKYFTAGGMADLYLARRPDHPGDLVLKKIQTRYVDFTKVVKMFIDEGRIAQALDHPNIVKIVDVGHHDGTYFIAMEYIAGRDLLAVCRRGVEVGQFLPRPLAVAILVQALRGLQHAHEKVGSDGRPLRVVHCDISPGNIVIGWGGTVKIVDFGISRATIQLRVEDHSVAGKYNYMAPEQIKGEAVDPRADIFAIGILLYELTTGKRLFRGRPEQVMRMVIEDPIARPIEIRPDFPPALDVIIMRALERDPEARYQTARALRDELMVWLAEQGEPHGKRQLAIYLRQIFGAEKQQESDEFGGEEDSDLVLEKGLPPTQTTESGMHELPLAVDPEEPEDQSTVQRLPRRPTPAAPAGPGVQARIARIESAGASPTVPAQPSAPSTPPRKSAGAGLTVGVAVLVVVLAVLYFLLVR